MDFLILLRKRDVCGGEGESKGEEGGKGEGEAGGTGAGGEGGLEDGTVAAEWAGDDFDDGACGEWEGSGGGGCGGEGLGRLVCVVEDGGCGEGGEGGVESVTRFPGGDEGAHLWVGDGEGCGTVAGRGGGEVEAKFQAVVYAAFVVENALACGAYEYQGGDGRACYGHGAPVGLFDVDGLFGEVDFKSGVP